MDLGVQLSGFFFLLSCEYTGAVFVVRLLLRPCFFVGSDSKHRTGWGFLTVKNGTSTGKNTDDVIFFFSRVIMFGRSFYDGFSSSISQYFGPCNFLFCL